MNNIDSCLLSWINDKGYYSQSYGKNNNMLNIDILVDNYGGQNKNNVMICLMKIIKERGFFSTAIFNFYIKVHTKNYCDYAFNSPNVLYRNQNVFTFEK